MIKKGELKDRQVAPQDLCSMNEGSHVTRVIGPGRDKHKLIGVILCQT